MALILGIVLAVAGVALIVAGKLASNGRLKRNRFVGLRTRATTVSDEAWHAAHRVGGPAIVWAGIASLAVGLGLAILNPKGPDVAALVIVSLMIVVALVLVSARNGTQAAKAAEARRLEQST
jgi:uncharacterized membrane protein